MFNLIVGIDAKSPSAEISAGRVYDSEGPLTQAELTERAELPTVVMQEGAPNDGGLAYFVNLTRLTLSGKTVRFRVRLDQELEPFPAELIDEIHLEHDLSASWDWHHTCWQIGQGDIFRSLYERNARADQSNRPTVFNISVPPRIDASKVACMMPFRPEFDDVYASIKAACESNGLSAVRVDEVYRNTAIINDIAEIIDTAAFVVCDLSQQNPNVMYETGIAHTLGRKVILLAQNIASDLPFDLRHIRCIGYSAANQAGRNSLQTELSQMLQNLLEEA